MSYKVLVTGATGFIGSKVVSALLKTGHEVKCCVHDTKKAARLFPPQMIVACDFNKDTDPVVWINRLRDIDIVINCVGILQENRNQSIYNIHSAAPRALFTACAHLEVKKIIQLSALGVDEPLTPYAASKKEADDYLMQIPIDWIILRPSIVFGTGSAGGTSLFRGLAGFPGFIPLIGDGEYYFQPIFIDDLVQAIINLINSSQTKLVLNAVGGEKIRIKEYLEKLRYWLGFRSARFISLPLKLVYFFARLGDWINRIPINSTSFLMLINSQTDNPQAFSNAVGFKPKSFGEVLLENPSQTQDRWHARLYFLKPILRFAIASVWISSSFIPFIFYEKSLIVMQALSLSVPLKLEILRIGAIFNFIVGCLTLFNWRFKQILKLELFLIVFYSLLLTIIAPAMWIRPLAPVIKNIPFFLATLVMLTIADE